MGVKTERVERSIRDMIASGQLRLGERLQSELQLAQQLDAGLMTIRHILMNLATEGTIRSEYGRGDFLTGVSEGIKIRSVNDRIVLASKHSSTPSKSQ